jgi:single-stranded DNA-binding protein
VASVSKIVIIGNVGRDPELRMTPNGRLVYVEGRFTPRTYTDREGKERLSLDISASDFQMLDPRRDRDSGMGGDNTVPARPEGEKSFDPDEIPF